jgi:hypothetical protein
MQIKLSSSSTILAISLFSNPVLAESPAVTGARALIESAPESVTSYLDTLPETYSFQSRFDGKSSVSYTGQIFRQVLMNDLSSFISSLEKGSYPGLSENAYVALDSYYSYTYDAELSSAGAINGFTEFEIGGLNNLGERMPIAEGSMYDDIQEEGKQLRDKTAGNDNLLTRGELKGWASDVYGISLSSVDADKNDDGIVEPEDFIQALLTVIAREAADGETLTLGNERINAAAVMPNGVHLGELLEKFMMGAVSFSQAAEDYLNTDAKPGKGLSADNKELAKAGVNYTALEHHWDEGFGYFGAARDYVNYPVEVIAAKQSLDTNNDAKISLLSEKNYSAAVYAAKRKLGSSIDGNVKDDYDFSSKSFSYFLKGRHLIASGNEAFVPYAKAYAILAINQWERVLAASSIHYINSYLSELESFGSETYRFSELAKVWSEAKGFALSFQFNPKSSMSDSDFDRLHQLLGDSPAVPGQATQADVKAYEQSLLMARSLIAESFGFDASDVSVW